MSEIDKTPFEKALDSWEQRQETINAFLADLDSGAWRAMMSVLAAVFVATHTEMRREHSPRLPQELLDRELLRSYYCHMQSWLKELPDTTAPVTLDQIPKIRMLLELHGQMIGEWLAVSPEDWPLLHS